LEELISSSCTEAACDERSVNYIEPHGERRGLTPRLWAAAMLRSSTS
jgi:hypothetical protein